jgi:glycosyltransferase involved in cell wall biosynthesis
VRIGLDWRPTFEGRGGIPVYVRGLVAGLAERFPDDRLLLYGHQVRGRCGRGRRTTAPPPPRASLRAAPIPSRAADALGRLGVGADVLVGGCDVFHATDYAWLAPSRAAFVATIHDVLFEELPGCYTAGMRIGLRRVTRRLVRHAARLLVPSVRTKAGLVERFGADPARVDVVPLAPRPLSVVEPARFDRPTFLAVGTLEPRKNLHRVIEAFGRVRARGLDADLVVVGARGWLDDAILAAAAGTAGVRVEGAVEDARLAALYAGASALVYPSLGEGFGLPVVEAMAAALPVVTSAGTTCAEVAGAAALLVDPYDVEALADAMSRVAADGGLRAELGERGRLAASRYSWAKTAEGTRASYERAIGGRT